MTIQETGNFTLQQHSISLDYLGSFEDGPNHECEFHLREKLDSLYDQYLNLLDFEDPFGDINS